MSNHPHRSYYPALDGFRGLACIIVVAYHNFPQLNKYLFFGWSALDMFFVLSGFLITDILIRTMGDKDYLKNFYVRRILRVMPLYYTSLILFLVILPRIRQLPVQLDYFVSHQAWFWFSMQNWLLVFFPVRSPSTLNHLWSLAVEEQFYLVWPLVFALVRKPKILVILLGLLLALLAGTRFWLWSEQIEGLAYYNLFTFTRIDGICIGCMVALMQKINPGFIGKHLALIVLTFAGFNYLFYFFNLNQPNSFPYLGMVGYSTFSMLFGIVVYDIINRKSRFFDLVLNVPVMKWAGKISYGTYIFHWPLYQIISPGLVQFFSRYTTPGTAEMGASITASLLSFLAGFISFRYFEQYFLRMKKKYT